jgi:dihydrofolate synthase/folylpolyglutamate synthase
MQELTFFEIGTALGFVHFVRRCVDLAIVEVGLGGRFDSTNVCAPLFSIITSISFDHTQLLGDTLAKIAYEKAGIIKPDRPAISGVRNLEARQVIEKVCRERGSALRQIGVDFSFAHEPALIDAGRERWPSVKVTTRKGVTPALALGLIGEHQACNAAVAVAAVEELTEQGVPVRASAVAAGLAGVVWPARLEIMSRQPLVLLDCAHNVASARALVLALDQSFPLPAQAHARRILIFGGNRDKDLAGMLELLAPWFERIFLTSIHGNARCLPPDQLAALLPADKQTATTQCRESSEAWGRARAEARPSDLICIAGSVFLAGELRPMIMECS